MNTGPNSATGQFLLAAKQSEISALTNLSHSCEVVTAVNELIHQLQRERGLSNVFLASGGNRFSNQRQEQMLASLTSEEALRQLLTKHYLEGSGHGSPARLLSSIAQALNDLDHFNRLRGDISGLSLTAAEATRAFSRLIEVLLTLVFEAADSAGDAIVTRSLVALFYYMQGKEYAGQERAWGAIGFAEGQFTPELRDKLEELKFRQQQCFDTFTTYADTAAANALQDIEDDDKTGQLKQLRELIGKLTPADTIASDISEVWYEVATDRIDRFRDLEIKLVHDLLQLSRQRIRAAEKSLREHRQHLDALGDPGSRSASMTGSAANTSHRSQGPHHTALSGSVYELLRLQSEHITEMGHQLNDARQALHERKQIERAKGLLMTNFGLSEEEAYQRIRKKAMQEKVRMAEMAESLIRAADKAARSSPE